MNFVLKTVICRLDSFYAVFFFSLSARGILQLMLLMHAACLSALLKCHIRQ